MTEVQTGAETEENRIREFFWKYRMFVYSVVFIVAMFGSGAVLQALAEPLVVILPGVNDVEIIHASAGLIAAASIVFAFYLLLVGLLWAALFLTRKYADAIPTL